MFNIIMSSNSKFSKTFKSDIKNIGGIERKWMHNIIKTKKDFFLYFLSLLYCAFILYFFCLEKMDTQKNKDKFMQEEHNFVLNFFEYNNKKFIT
jgi:hypothetical protein